MNNVEIQDNVTLIGCVVCSKSVISADRVLKDQKVGHGETVGAKEREMSDVGDEGKLQNVRRPSLVVF